jgi:hypothetical protein
MTSERLERGDVLDCASRVHLSLHDQSNGDATAGSEQAQHDEENFDCHGRVLCPVPTDGAQRGLFEARSPDQLVQTAGGYPNMKLAA